VHLSNEQQAQKQQHMAMPLVLIWDNARQAWGLPYTPCIIEVCRHPWLHVLFGCSCWISPTNSL